MTLSKWVMTELKLSNESSSLCSNPKRTLWAYEAVTHEIPTYIESHKTILSISSYQISMHLTSIVAKDSPSSYWICSLNRPYKVGLPGMASPRLNIIRSIVDSALPVSMSSLQIRPGSRWCLRNVHNLHGSGAGTCTSLLLCKQTCVSVQEWLTNLFPPSHQAHVCAVTPCLATKPADR